MADLNRGSNSLNSISGCTDIGIRKLGFAAKTQFLRIVHKKFIEIPFISLEDCFSSGEIVEAISDGTTGSIKKVLEHRGGKKSQ